MQQVVETNVARVPTRPVRKGIYFDARHNDALWAMLRDPAVGWRGIFEEYAWPELESGDILLVRFPMCQKTENIANWRDVMKLDRQYVAESNDLYRALKRCQGEGIEFMLYLRRPSDIDAGTGSPEERMYNMAEPLFYPTFDGATRVLDGAIEEGVVLPKITKVGAALVDTFADFGGKVVIEPAWAAGDKWAWEYPCLVTEEYWKRMNDAKFVGWRPHTWDIPEVIRMHHSALGPAREDVQRQLSAFLSDCRRTRHTALIPGGILTDFKLTWAEVGRA